MSLFRKPWPVLRRAGVLSQTGDTRGTVVVTDVADTIYGSCQPMDGKSAQALPVGRADLGKLKIYTRDTLEVSEEATGKVGDIVLYAGFRWEVISSSPWDNGLLAHNEYVAEYRGAA